MKMNSGGKKKKKEKRKEKGTHLQGSERPPHALQPPGRLRGRLLVVLLLLVVVVAAAAAEAASAAAPWVVVVPATMRGPALGLFLFLGQKALHLEKDVDCFA